MRGVRGACEFGKVHIYARARFQSLLSSSSDYRRRGSNQARGLDGGCRHYTPPIDRGIGDSGYCCSGENVARPCRPTDVRKNSAFAKARLKPRYRTARGSKRMQDSRRIILTASGSIIAELVSWMPGSARYCERFCKTEHLLSVLMAVLLTKAESIRVQC